MTRYFAYGSNMDVAQMARRCPGAPVRGTAALRGWRVAMMRSGYATIVPDPAGEVLGLLWDLSPDHEKALDGYEGVAKGSYRRETITVTGLADGKPHRALVYVGLSPVPGAPKPGYLEKILDAARSLGFPEPYVASLTNLR